VDWLRVSAGVLPFLAERPDFGIAAQDGLSIGPGKRRGNLAGVADHRTPRRLVTQVSPLKVEGISVLHADPSHHVGGGPAERRLRTSWQ
jgi:hypothetical protein